MLAAVVVLAALVVSLVGLLVVERRRGAGRLAASQAESQRLAAEGGDLRRQLDEARAAAQAERSDAAERLARAQAERGDTARRLELVEAERRHAAGQLEAATADAAAQRERAEAAESERDRLRHDLGESESRNARLELRLAAAGDGAPEVAALWELELARSERTWRYSVAPLPLGPSPFPNCDDPLRLAVEIEAAALREEVGAPLEVRWDAGPVTDHAHALLVLRLSQELLAAAAREGQNAVLAVTGDDDVTLDLRGEEGEPPLPVDAPPVADHLVTVDTDHGLRLVVHRDRAVHAG